MLNLLWDLDGTIIDSLPEITLSLNQLLHDHQLPELSVAQAKTRMTPEITELIAQLIGRHDVTEVAKAREVFRAYYADVMHQSDVFDDIETCLARFQRSNAQQFVVTAKRQSTAQTILSEKGLMPYFIAVYGQPEQAVNFSKAELLSDIIREEQLTPSNCIYIGDSSADMAAARLHHMTAIGVTWGMATEDQLWEAGAHFVVERPSELIDVVKQASDCGC